MAAKTSVHKKAPARRDILERFHLLREFIAMGDPEPLTERRVEAMSNCTTPYSNPRFTLQHEVP
jgi:hypothetical protein